jgi:hypothetical protein
MPPSAITSTLAPLNEPKSSNCTVEVAVEELQAAAVARAESRANELVLFLMTLLLLQ